MKKFMVFALAFFMMAGCANRLPEPEAEKVKAMETKAERSKEMTVHHSVQGNSLYIECFIPGVSFSNAQAGGKVGKVLFYMDGQLYNEYDTAAFVVKDIPDGAHTFTIEIVGADNRPLGFSKKFAATVG